MQHKIVLAYVPVIQRGYIDFLSQHSDARNVYIWGDTLISLESVLQKEIRALKPQEAKVALRAVTGRDYISVV